MPDQDESYDYELIKASQAGDTQAMERLIKLYAEAVHSLIYSILGNRDIVEDVAQETFLKMLMAIEHYEFRAPFRSWLFRIAVNLCRDQMRRSRVRQIVTYFQHREGSQEEFFIDTEQNPLADLEKKENLEHLHRGIAKLPPSLRTVIVLRDVQDLTYEEIAKTLNWRLGTVKSRLFRARQELGKLLNPYLEEC